MFKKIHQFMLLRLLFSAIFYTLPVSIIAQISFTKHTELLTTAHNSGNAVAVTDMNGDGRDDIVRLEQGFRLTIAHQTAPGAPFLRQTIGDVANAGQWGICAADIDDNGRPDMLVGGSFDGIKIILANDDGSAYTTVPYEDPFIFAQAANFTDINGDGRLDAFVCNDDGVSLVLLNTADGLGTLVYAPQAIQLATVPPSDNSGNYGSVWCDVDNDGDSDLYISKCQGSVTDPSDGRRINQIFFNNGNGAFTQDTTNTSGLRIGAQSWSADFGDIDNDGDFDCFLINHYESCQLLENDGAGHFTDITTAAGLRDSVAGFGIQAVFRDFDNDGFVDILLAGTRHFMFRNNGDKTFSGVPVLDDIQMRTFALGDLNGDGFQDIYAGYAAFFPKFDTPSDVLWLSDGNTNHFFGMTLRGAPYNRSAVGARVFLYSALGLQTREVRSGESYGIMNSMQIHFGLGQVTAIDSVVIRWPSGTVDVLYTPVADQYLLVEEGKCVVPFVRIEAGGSTVFCSGDSVQIALQQPYTAYQWNTGDTSAVIAAKVSGWYEVTVTTAEGCTAVSNAISVAVDPVEIPGVAVAAGDTVLCAGETAVLMATAAQSYLWNTGDTSATIVVGEPGLYSVQIQGLCAQFSSEPVNIRVLTPEIPTPTPDTVAPGTSATLRASGDRPTWYETPTGGTPLAVGSAFATPPLTTTTTYWVAGSALFTTPNQFIGMIDHEGSEYAGPQTDGRLIFDCWTPVRLLRAKVYTDMAGLRKIDLRQADGAVLQSVLVHIPTGASVIDLNFEIPVGENLQLATDTNINKQVFGFLGPQLRRSDQNTAFPYTLPGYLSVKYSNFGPLLYFYFFDWEIETPDFECLSTREPVTAVVDSTLVTAPGVVAPENIRVYPNPATGSFWVEWPSFGGGDLRLVLRNGAGAVVWSRPHRALPAGPLVEQIRVGDLPAGNYWLELSTPTGTVLKLVTHQ
jgi:hypothetical protein